ncbi:MAG: hypothetical protein FWG03_04920 [Clostridiales bacterium]|nr:hypothetical protein [Clostridiales bacterium]
MNEMFSFIISLLIALALTAAIEGAIVFALYRKPLFVYYSLLWNLLTNPALNLGLFLAVSFGGAAYAPSVMAGEACVFLAEALLIRLLLELPLKKALALSLLLNAASFLVGLVLNQYFF